MSDQFAYSQNITKELLGGDPTAMIELFSISNIQNTEEVIRFHGGVNEIKKAIIFDSNPYFYIPFEANQFEKSTSSIPRPNIRLINVGGFFSKYIQDKNDLVGATVERDRTFLRFLDSENFPNYNSDIDYWSSKGVHPDPTAKLAPETWAINRKVSETKNYIDYELVSPLELENIQFPRRQIINNYCPWRYRGEGCGYTGPPRSDANEAVFSSISASTINDGEWLKGSTYAKGEYVFISLPEGSAVRKVFYVCIEDHVADLNNKASVSTTYWVADQCSKTLNSCKMRFKGDETQQLPFGGFPGSRLY